MIINIILILIAIPIVVLPFYDLYKKDQKRWYKKLTEKGIIFYVLIIAIAALQVVKEFQNSKNERESVSRSDTMKADIDSLKKVTFFSSDTIGDLRDSISRLTRIIGSVGDKSTSIESKVDALSERGKVGYRLDLKKIESDRPIFNLNSAKITTDEMIRDKHIDFLFFNTGRRALTNVYGKIYGMMDTIVINLGTLSASRSDIFAPNQGFTLHQKLSFNPDSISLSKPIYYYFTITYNDIIYDTPYKYEIASKLNPFKKGYYLPELTMCPNWEITKMKSTIEKATTVTNK
jgi:hypothetical protein